MKSILGRLVIVLAVAGVLCLSVDRVVAQGATGQNDWASGGYIGWIYFLAKEDTDQEYSQEEITGHGVVATFFESHSNLVCDVHENGTGFCTATFPMDITVGQSYTYTTPDCEMQGGLSMRSIALNSNLPGNIMALAPMADDPVISFQPVFGKANGNQYFSSSGGEGCDASLVSGFQSVPSVQFPPGSLTLRVGIRTALTVGGTCSMEGLPRQASNPMGPGMVYRDNLAILDCRWMVFRYDPSMEPPAGGGK
jgi:hypothetical protein